MELTQKALTMRECLAECATRGLVDILPNKNYVIPSEVNIKDDDGTKYTLSSSTLTHLFSENYEDIRKLAAERGHKVILRNQIHDALEHGIQGFIIDALEYLIQNKVLNSYKKGD